MTKKYDEPTVDRHVQIFESDWHVLERLARDSKLSVSELIRKAVRKTVREYNERVVRRLDESNSANILREE